ncbi:hypothetical protein F443_21134 [Phytophthora nicotianae P1569]|uniref:Uncharacterized protein n=1 Tax=Phytophthora nicotianae P1569 TaxID=1317065 RepID=V9DYK9_PHYNI|nr:hypothetical protein F443_21134 [Phytophthora nicotianae P1569]
MLQYFQNLGSSGKLWIGTVINQHVLLPHNVGTNRPMDNTAVNGELEVVQWLHLNSQYGRTTAPMACAAGNKHPEVIKWLHYNRSKGCISIGMDFAAPNDPLAIGQ